MKYTVLGIADGLTPVTAQLQDKVTLQVSGQSQAHRLEPQYVLYESNIGAEQSSFEVSFVPVCSVGWTMAAGRSVRVQCRREPYSLLVEQRGREGCISLHQDGAVQWSPPGQVSLATTGGLYPSA